MVVVLGALLGSRLEAGPAYASGEAAKATLHPINQATGAVNTSITLGTVKFTQGQDALVVVAQVNGLSVAEGEQAATADGSGNAYPHGIHVHEGNACTATTDKDGKTVPAGAAGPHFDPKKSGSHKGPDGDGHAGDLPNLRVTSDGSGILETKTTRFSVDQIRGRTVILHANQDNYTDTPTNGGSGARIACGVIE